MNQIIPGNVGVVIALTFGVFASGTGAGAAEVSNGPLQGKRVAILAADGFEQSELFEPRKALDAAGAMTFVVSPNDSQVRAWNSNDWGEKVNVDVPLKRAKADQFDALLLPGGVMNPDKLRMDPEAVQFVRSFVDVGKPVAAICHGPWT